MSKSNQLFRAAALQAQRANALGDVVLIQPLSFRLLAGTFAGIAVALLCFLIGGSYTDHTTLVGQLVPNRGIIKVHSAQFGTIVEKHVREGERVAQGQTLFIISGERLNAELGATHTLIGQELARSTLSLEQQIDTLHRLEVSDRASLARMLDALAAERSNLLGMIEGQRERVRLAVQASARYAELRAEDFVSEEHLIVKKEELLDQRSRLQALERENSITRRELADLERRILGLPLKYRNEMAELERAMANIRQQQSENEIRRRIAITAPEDGIATAVVVEIGQFVDSSKPLLSIVPADAELEGHLFGPSRAVGFVNVGDPVLIRYQAYPYQKFGHHAGRVRDVSLTTLPAAELPSHNVLGNGAQEPVYRVIVDIASRDIEAYGRARPLQAGMAIEADVLRETRKLYEWVLEPLYTLTGRVH